MDTTTQDPQMDPALHQDFEALGELDVPTSWGDDTDSEGRSTFPEPPRPAELQVDLPGGLFLPDGQRLRKVEVRELNGEDEERLSRIKSIADYKRVLLEIGVVSFEGRKPAAGMLGDMLIGDRDYLIVAIRRATFGDTLDIPVQCRACEEQQEITYHFVDDLPIRDFKGEGTILPIELRDGRKASVAIPTAADEDAVLEAAERSTLSESNTLMLQRIIEDIDGMPVTTRGEVLKIGMADRRTILDTVYEHRVGPQFDEVTYDCARCGEGGPVVLSVFEMFR